MFELILIIIGLILILISAFNVAVPRVSLLALGIFFVVLGFAIPVFAAA